MMTNYVENDENDTKLNLADTMLQCGGSALHVLAAMGRTSALRRLLDEKRDLNLNET